MVRKFLTILISLLMTLSSSITIYAIDGNTEVNHASVLEVFLDDTNDTVKTNNIHKITIDASNANANQKDSKPMRVYLHDANNKPLTNVEIIGMDEEGTLYFPYDNPMINKPIELKDVVVTDALGNVTERYLEFEIVAGSSVEMELELFVPGGINGNTDLVLTPEIVQPSPNDIVSDPIDVHWTAEFSWENLSKTVDRTSYIIGSNPSLNNDPVLNYAYNVTNKPGLEGIIWEKQIEIKDTLTLPEGLTLPDGYVIDVANNKIKTSGGDDIYNFNFDLSNITVSEDKRTITVTGTIDNPHKDGDGVLESDSNPLSQWHSQLHTSTLTKTSDTITGDITNTMETTFVPCVDDEDPIELEDDATTTITQPTPPSIDPDPEDPPVDPDPEDPPVPPVLKSLTISKYDGDNGYLLDMYKDNTTITYEITGLPTGMTFKKPTNATITINDDGTVVIIPSDSNNERVILVPASNSDLPENTFTFTGPKLETNSPEITLMGIDKSKLDNVKVKEIKAPDGYNITYTDAKKPVEYYSGYYADFYDKAVLPTPEENGNSNIIGLYKITGEDNNKIIYDVPYYYHDWYDNYRPIGAIDPKNLKLNVYFGMNKSQKVKFYHTQNNIYVYDGIYDSGSSWETSISITESYYLLQMKNLPDGIYVVEEERPPYGYEKSSEDMCFKVEGDNVYLKKDTNNTTSWELVTYEINGMPNKYLGLNNNRLQTELRIHKIDSSTGLYLNNINENNPVVYSLLTSDGEPMLLLKDNEGVYHYAGLYEDDVLTPITADNPYYPFNVHDQSLGVKYNFIDGEKVTSGYLYTPKDKKIALPCMAYIYVSAANAEQRPGGPFPQPYALRYEMNFYNGHEWSGWYQASNPTYTKQGGNQASIIYPVTQQFLDSFENGYTMFDISVRATRYPNAPISQIGQVVKFGWSLVVSPEIFKTSSGNPATSIEIVNSSNIVATSSTIKIKGLPHTNYGDEYILTEVSAPEGYDVTDEEYLVDIDDPTKYYGYYSYNYEYVKNHKTGTGLPDETNNYIYFGKVSGLENGLVHYSVFNTNRINPKGLELVVRNSEGKQLAFDKIISSNIETFEYEEMHESQGDDIYPIAVTGNYVLRFKNIPCPTDTDLAEYFEYTIEEVSAPKGYEVNPEKVTFRVYKNYSKYTVVKGDSELEVAQPATPTTIQPTQTSGKKYEYYFNSYYIVINNEEVNRPSFITVEKQDEYGRIINDSQTKFMLKDKSGNFLTHSDVINHDTHGNVYTLNPGSSEEVFSADDKGRFSIKDLPKGEYTLIEVEAPHGYELISTPITIKVDGYGDVIKIVVKDPSLGFGIERFASSSYKKIEEIDNEDNAGYSFYNDTSDDTQGLTNFITVDNTSKKVRYSLIVTNQSKKNFENLVIIDKLPEPNDTGVINLSEQRGSEFSVRLLDNPNFKVYELDENRDVYRVITNYILEFSDNASFTESDFNGETNAERWNSVDNLSKSFRLRFEPTYMLPTKHSLVVEFDCKLMSDAEPGKIAWNNFGYRYKVQTSILGTYKTLTPEPLKVGVKVKNKPVITPPGDTYKPPVTGIN